ncbi:Acyl-CoA-binding domain-containing protein 5, partial [Nibea albiflora]
WAKKDQPEEKVGQSKYYTAPDKMPVPKQKRVKKMRKGHVKSDEALDPSSIPDRTQEKAAQSQLLRLTTEKIKSRKKEGLIQGNVHKSVIPDGTLEKAAEGDATTLQNSADRLRSEVNTLWKRRETEIVAAAIKSSDNLSICLRHIDFLSLRPHELLDGEVNFDHYDGIVGCVNVHRSHWKFVMARKTIETFPAIPEEFNINPSRKDIAQQRRQMAEDILLASAKVPFGDTVFLGVSTQQNVMSVSVVRVKPLAVGMLALNCSKALSEELLRHTDCGPTCSPASLHWSSVWDAWSRLGEMSSERAMAAYVDEMKKVAQEVIDTMPMNEKTASLFHHFEPLYLVIDDMPRPPESLLTLRGLKGGEHADRPAEMKDEDKEPDALKEDSFPDGADPDQEFNVAELTANTILNDSIAASEGLVLTSDSESEIFCDSVDSMEQLSNVKIPAVKSNGFHNGHVSLESSPDQSQQLEGRLEVRQVGAGQGGEGADDGKGHGHNRRSRDTGREGSYHNWRERGVPQGSPRREAPGGGGGAGRGGGDGSEVGVERLYDAQLQQQIILALRRLREDMRSVMERLEVVERLAATHTQSSEWRPCLQCAASQHEERWWPFDVSGQTVLLFLLWPFVAQGLVYLLKKAQKRSRISS